MRRMALISLSLNAEAQKAIQDAWVKRLRIFTEPIQQKINRLHEQRGGWQKSRVAYYNEAPSKRCIDGGRWDFKCGLPGMVWAFESSRGHIHMSLWVSADASSACSFVRSPVKSPVKRKSRSLLPLFCLRLTARHVFFHALLWCRHSLR